MSDRFDHTLERKLESKPDEADDDVVNIRRIELITGTGRRRRWATTDKVRIVVESFEPGANVSEVARRHGISPQQLFAWRREARALIAEKSGELSATTPVDQAPPLTPEPHLRSRRPQPSTETAVDAPAFAHVVIAASPAAAPPSSPPPPLSTGGHHAPGTIEITIGDAIVRVVGQIEPAMLVAVLRAVRRSS